MDPASDWGGTMMGGQVVLLVLLLGIAGAIMEGIKEKNGHNETHRNTNAITYTQKDNDRAH